MKLIDKFKNGLYSFERDIQHDETNNYKSENRLQYWKKFLGVNEREIENILSNGLGINTANLNELLSENDNFSCKVTETNVLWNQLIHDLQVLSIESIILPEFYIIGDIGQKNYQCFMVFMNHF